MEQNHLRKKVTEFCEEWSEVSIRVTNVEADITSLASDIDAAKADIGSLLAEKRAASRQDKQHYRDLIQEAKDRKSNQIEESRAKRRELSELRARKAATHKEGRSLQRQMQAESRRLGGELKRLGVIGPGWAANSLLQLRQTVASGQRFCEDQLRLLEEAIGAEGNRSETDDFVYVDEPQFWSVLGPTPPSQNPLHLVEPPAVVPYLTQDGTMAVQTETYTIFDTVDVAGERSEMKGVIHARALLQSQGRGLVLEIGGKGMTDILSLDQQNRLWITEVKATENSSDLTKAGLVRNLIKSNEDDADPIGRKQQERVMELSPQWLEWKDSGLKLDRPALVLRAISKAIDSENDPARREQLRIVSSAYHEAMRQNFSPLACHKELVQVGMQSDGDVLKPVQLMQSKAIDKFCKEVQPDRIVQINVLQGSKNSEIFDRPPADSLTVGATPQNLSLNERLDSVAETLDLDTEDMAEESNDDSDEGIGE